MEAGTEGFFGGHVGGGDFGFAFVQLSGLEGGGEWTLRRCRHARGNGTDAGAGGSGGESRADQFCADLGSAIGGLGLGDLGFVGSDSETIFHGLNLVVL